MLKDKNLDRRVKLAALQHHERFGGTGYPYGLMGSGIEYFSSIVEIYRTECGSTVQGKA